MSMNFRTDVLELLELDKNLYLEKWVVT
uniref:Uncharacterized protein n=1 Tax=Rhizophora mucronata TaxID=61149 RepID=A0A2P2PZQ6_RHIMU